MDIPSVAGRSSHVADVGHDIKETPEFSPDPHVVGDRDGEDLRAVGGQIGRAGLHILEFSKLDQETRERIVGEWTPREEAPEEREARRQRCRVATAEYDAEFGPLTPEERAWADAILDELGVGVEG